MAANATLRLNAPGAGNDKTWKKTSCDGDTVLDVTEKVIGVVLKDMNAAGQQANAALKGHTGGHGAAGSTFLVNTPKQGAGGVCKKVQASLTFEESGKSPLVVTVDYTDLPDDALQCLKSCLDGVTSANGFSPV